MSRLGFVWALFVSSSIAGCFNVNFAGLSFECDPAQPGGAACPDGYQCNGSMKLCVPTSGSGTDLIVSTSACPSGIGYDVTLPGQKKVYACPTKISAAPGSTADSLCKAGYRLCQDSKNIDLTACGRVGSLSSGFFISAVAARRDDRGEVLCDAPTLGHPYPLWAGCGRTVPTVVAQGGDCQGFRMTLDCPQTGTFNCNGQTLFAQLTDVENNDPASGILCCAP